MKKNVFKLVPEKRRNGRVWRWTNQSERVGLERRRNQGRQGKDDKLNSEREEQGKHSQKIETGTEKVIKGWSDS